MIDYYKFGVLNEDTHSRLVLNINSISVNAGVPEAMIYKPVSKHCSKSELEWLSHVRQHQSDCVGGLMYTGSSTRVDDRMMSAAGLLLRNFIDARLMSKHEVLATLKKGKSITNTMLFIPDFYVGSTHGVAKWEIGDLLSLLLERRAQNLMTFLYVKSLQELSKDFGLDIARHLSTHYNKIGE